MPEPRPPADGTASWAARAALAALAGLALVSCAHVRGRDATTRCVERTSRGRIACHRACEDEFQARFLGCYGPPSGCTERCQAEQVQCQDAPFRSLGSCEGDPADPRSCRTRFEADKARCTTDPHPRECEDAARGRASQCWQACQRRHEPALERCAAQLKACLDACVAG